MHTERVNQTTKLRDGRTLGYAEYGISDGTPVFYFTGGNSSRFEGRWFEEAAAKKNIRLIVPDRPGFGLSSYQPDRKLLNWPEDVTELANHLSVEMFSEFGLSGGGPHVLATAYKIPERINRAAIISGIAPPEMPDLYHAMWPPVRLIYLTAKYLPKLNHFLLKQMTGFYSHEEQMDKRMKQVMPVPDIELFESKPNIIKIFAEATKEAHRNGIEGDAHEWKLYVSDWGFKLSEINTEINLWYGQYDRQVPIGMGRYIASLLSKSNLIEVENGGHFSTINNYIEDIFDYLTQ
jgi:pimeloyl-ACP methyl ester carboxylesterase